MTGVQNLDRVESHVGETQDARVRRGVSGVGPHGKTTGLMHQRDGIGDIEAIFRHIRGTTEADPPIKGVAEIAHPAASNHRPCDVWTTDRSLVRLSEHQLHGDRNAVPIEHFDDLHRALHPTGLQFNQRGPHRLLIG